jgi:DNA-binding response OmpR family regulator
VAASKKILVVEDDIDINKALVYRLRANGYEVSTASDGLVGLCTAVRDQPDLMILDIALPAGDGFSIVERLRANTKLGDTPFIVLTASRMPELRDTALKMGAFAFVEKPYDAGVLLEHVRAALSACSPVQ